MITMTTPLGDVVTYATTGSLDTRSNPPDAHQVLPGNRQWRRWTTDAVVAEVVTGPYSPSLPSDMAVLGCEVAVWRLWARGSVVQPAIACRWSSLPADADGGPDSGEGLDAQTWDIGRHAVSMGTEDGDQLAVRARRGQLAPSRLAPELRLMPIDYLPDGLCVPLPSLQRDELVQIHFVLAWATVDNPYQHDTWFAVDQSPLELLDHLGVDRDPGGPDSPLFSMAPGRSSGES